MKTTTQMPIGCTSGSLWHVVYGEWLRHWIEMRRYWFNTLGSIIALYLFFLMLFFGASWIATQVSPNTQPNLKWLIGGYIVWSLSVFTYMMPAQIINQGALAGTLEQMALSPWGLGWVLIGAMSAGLISNILTMSLLLAAAILTSGQSVILPWGWITIVMLLVGLQGFAIGLMIAGLALNFKKVQSLYTLLQFAFVAFLAIPWELHPWVKVVPFRWPYELMQRILEGTVDTSWFEIMGAIFLAIVYLGLGWMLLHLGLQRARRLGQLGHY